MEIEFPEPTDTKTTLTLYLLSTTSEQRKTHLNTLLVSLAEDRTPLTQIVDLIQPHIKGDTLATAFELLHEIVKRKKDAVVRDGDESKVIKFLCQYCLNLSTSLMALKTLLELLKRGLSSASFEQLFELLTSPKFHPPSHRQEIRLVAYQLILLISQHEQFLDTPLLRSKYINMVIDSTFEERDPRNIGSMFELYHWLVSHIDNALIEPYKEKMFGNIEAYYPIDYIGDEDMETTVTLEELNRLLDDCITLPLFQDLCYELLEEKTASPPIAQFLCTIKKYMDQNPSVACRMENILHRFLQDEFLEDTSSYPLIIDCLEVFLKHTLHPGSISLHNYTLLTSILTHCIETLLSSKGGFVLALMKMLSSNKLTKSLSTTFVLNHLIINYRLYNNDNLAYLLGLAITVLERETGQSEELAQLLNMSLVDIFGSGPMHLKIMVMKILMILNKDSAEGNVANIVGELLRILKDKKEELVLRKSVVEFVLHSGNKVLRYETQEYVHWLLQNIEAEYEDNIEVLVYYIVLTDPAKINQLLGMRVGIADTVIEEICSIIFKLKPKNISRLLTSVDYHTISSKHKERIMELLNKAVKDEEIEEALEEHVLSLKSISRQDAEVFYPVIHTHNPELLKILVPNDTFQSRIRHLDPQALLDLQTGFSPSEIELLSQPLPSDNPTLRQYIFQKIYPLINTPSAQLPSQLLPFIILQQTPPSLLLSSISPIIELITSKVQDSSPQISTVSLNILNLYFDKVGENKYDKIVETIKKVLWNNRKYSMPALCSGCEVLGKMAGIGGQVKFRKGVLEALEQVLGHPKRKVRKAGAYSLNKWYYM